MMETSVNILNYVWRIRNKLISYYCDICQQKMVQTITYSIAQINMNDMQ